MGQPIVPQLNNDIVMTPLGGRLIVVSNGVTTTSWPTLPPGQYAART